MPRRKKLARPARSPISDYLAKIGRKGGQSGTGKVKARSSAQARKAALKRWRGGKSKKAVK